MIAEPLLPTAAGNKLLSSKQKQTKRNISLFYGADEYLDHLKKKYEHDHEIATMKNLMPDEGDHEAKHAVGTEQKGKILSVDKDENGRSKKTQRKHPVSNKPDPMPPELAFMFTKLSQEQIMYMWNFLTMIHVVQWLLIIGYAFSLKFFGHDFYWLCTFGFGMPFAYICIQNIYVDHDVMHGATFPPYSWQKYITHPFADFFSLPWEEFVLEHNRHHASTIDLLIQGEFGWDPEEYHYWLQQWSDKWYCLMLSLPLIPVLHFLGLNDTGSLFSLEWYLHFPDEAAGGKCHKDFWTKWLPRRLYHNAFVLTCWAAVWCLGAIPYGGLAEGWRFLIPVSVAARVGYGSAWMFVTNFTHSLPWNRFLTSDPDRTWPRLHAIMAFVLGGRHRWNEMLFHDLHHAFPSAVGTLSQRGRFHGWEKVHDAALEIIHRGLFKPNGDEETIMQVQQRKRTDLHFTRKDSK
jgi:hypothetical protein